MNTILRKCKSLSKLGRSTSSYTNLRSKSARDYAAAAAAADDDDDYDAEAAGGGGCGGRSDKAAVVLVGRSRRRYSISTEYLNHPLMIALIDRSPLAKKQQQPGEEEVRVKCEVVLFDHLLWMLEDVDAVADDAATLDELAELYACS